MSCSIATLTAPSEIRGGVFLSKVKLARENIGFTIPRPGEMRQREVKTFKEKCQPGIFDVRTVAGA